MGYECWVFIDIRRIIRNDCDFRKDNHRNKNLYEKNFFSNPHDDSL